MGAITGIPLGAVQAFLLRGRVARLLDVGGGHAAAVGAWAGLSTRRPPGWASTVSTRSSVPSGAITFMALSGVLLDRLRAATPHPPPARFRQPPNPPSRPPPTVIFVRLRVIRSTA